MPQANYLNLRVNEECYCILETGSKNSPPDLSILGYNLLLFPQTLSHHLSWYSRQCSEFVYGYITIMRLLKVLFYIC